MSDNDIIKGLLCCMSSKCTPEECPYYDFKDCSKKNTDDAIDLINRLKAENETLKEERDKWYAEYHNVKYDLKQSKMNENSAHKLAEDYIAKFRTARAEAIKEFAERLKKISDYCYLGNIDSLAYRILEKDLNALVKDMTEEAE